MAGERLRSEIHPIDWVIGGMLLIATTVSAAKFPSNQQELDRLLTLHLALLSGFAVFAVAAIRRGRSSWVIFARPLVAIAIVYTFYTSLGLLGMDAMPYRADAALSRIDTILFAGTDPSFLLERFVTPSHVEFFAFFYSLFIIYVNLSLVLGALGRPPLERDQFFTGWVCTYVFCYLGYIFVPAHGPGAFHAAEYHVQLAGGYFYHTILKATAATGGELGVFPSLHGGASVYLCLFDFRTNRLRGLTYVPIVVLIFIATVFLRIHYVIDLIVGTAVALTFTRMGSRVVERWARLRQSRGLPALPGGEADVLPDLSNIRDGSVASVLPAY